MAILLLLCSGAFGANTPGKITIDAPLFEGGAGKEFFLQCARDYEKIRPNVHVNMYLDPRIADKVRVRILEGSWFELTNAFVNFWPLIDNGDVLKLNKYLDEKNWEGDSTWRDSFLPGTLNGYQDTKGDIYGIPLADYAELIWYNKKMFREHGWKIPVTWDDLFALCKEIKAAGIPPFAFQGRYANYISPLYSAAYYHLAGPDQWIPHSQLTPGTFSSPANVEAIRLVEKLAGNYFQPGCLGMSHTEAQLEFFLGHTAMVSCGAWLKSEMLGKIPAGFEMGCFNLPIVKGGKGDPSAVYVEVEPFVIMKNSAHPEAAVDFMKFMTSRKMAGLFARMQDIPVAVRGANEGNLSPDLDQMVKIVNDAKTTYGQVPGEGYPEMAQVYKDEDYQMVRAVQSPERIANDLERKAKDARNARNHPDRVIVNYIWQPAILLTILGLGLIYYLWTTARKVVRRSSPAAHSSKLRLSWGNILIFVVPAVLIYTCFVIVPSVQAFSWSVHQWNGLSSMNDMKFVGLLNFRRLLFESDAFWIALKNNFFLMVMIPLFVVPISLFLAAAVSRRVWGAKTFRVVFLFPNLIGGVAATLLWLQLYNPQGGLVNTALIYVGKALSFIGVTWLGNWFQAFAGFAWLDPTHLYWSLIPISIWGACGFNMILFLAGMESIPESYYEAAHIDGASQFRQFWTITVPLIWEMLAISLVMLFIGGMKAFEVIWLLTNQQPNTDNHVVATLMVQEMFGDLKVGQATAIGVLLFLIVFVCSVVTLRLMRRDSVEL